MEGRITQQSFAVSYEYPVVFTRGLFTAGNDTLERIATRLGEMRRHRIAVFIDDAVLAATSSLATRIADRLRQSPDRFELVAPPRPIPGGERCKNSLQTVSDLIGVFAQHKMDRQAFVLAVGGGAALDAIGFAAALFHRGLRLIRVPTTVLAQNDAGVGVKNAINFLGAKNLLGTFAPPFAVLNDLDFLRSLPAAAWTDGCWKAPE